MNFKKHDWPPPNENGDVKFQRRYTIELIIRNRTENNGQLPQYYCEDSHPAIVDGTIQECVH